MLQPLSKNKAALIRSLALKKNREEEGLFVVEGRKSVLELARSDFRIRALACTGEFWQDHGNVFDGKKCETFACSLKELEAVSQLQSADAALAVAEMRPAAPPPARLTGLTLALDRISDPGNFGTILRTADWFGVTRIVASKNTVDFYNPKVLQASMGSFCRVTVSYVDLADYLGKLSEKKLPIYAARKNGKPVHTFSFPKDCLVVLGNESLGVSPELIFICRDSIGIPAYGGAESLNVAASAAIFCDNYRRANASK